MGGSSGKLLPGPSVWGDCLQMVLGYRRHPGDASAKGKIVVSGPQIRDLRSLSVPTVADRGRPQGKNQKGPQVLACHWKIWYILQI